ncbi:MAG: hypothetical protein IKS48_03750 [Eubacterium sp.]|nr:hypothetical protein [Eubacterium sp.]
MNQILKDIKNRAFKLDVLGGLLLLLVGIGLTWYSSPHFFPYFFAKAPDLFQTSSSEFKEGNWYKCDNNVLLDYYCSDNSGRYYITTTKDGEYMGFFVYKNKTDIADQIANATYDYMEGKSDSMSSQFLSGKGYLAKMEPTEERYFTEFFEYDGKSIDEYKVTYYTFRLVTPWKLLTDDNGNSDIYTWFGLVIALVGIVMIIYFIVGGYKKPFDKAMKDYGILPESLDMDMMRAQQDDVAYIGEKYVAFATSVGGYVIPYNCLIWAYVEITRTQHRTYGIKTGTSKSYKMVFWDNNQKKNTVDVKDEERGYRILDEIHARAPYFMMGYNEDIANAADNGRFGDIVRAVDERRDQFYRGYEDVRDSEENI